MSSAIIETRRVFEPDLSAGALEALKWFALALMLVDHVNAYIFGWHVPLMYAAGRVAFPLFGFVLAYNLARAGNEQAADRVFVRLLLFGIAAQFFSMALRRHATPEGAWWQLNILLMFAIAVPLIQATRSTARWYVWTLVALVMLVTGALVEFHWSGLIYVLASYHFCARRTIPAGVVWFISAGLLTFENGNAWALAAIPVLLAFNGRAVHVPRLKWFFYAFYPLHLAALWAFTRFNAA